MRISFCAQTDPAPWLAALQQHLPQAQVEVWHPGSAHADYAIVWAPPQQFFDEQTALQAVFNMGPGPEREPGSHQDTSPRINNRFLVSAAHLFYKNGPK